MAKKRSPRKTTRVEELNDEQAAQGADELIEFDESAPAAAEALAQVEEADDDPSVNQIDPGLFRARDELEAQMGGFETVASALGAPTETPAAGIGNIVGWAVGEKSTCGRYTGDMAVKVYVVEKASSSKIDKAAKVPSEIGGYPTDVEETGEIKADVFTGRYRPAPGGSSVGHPEITAGTLGCLVVRNNRKLCILSNNHVLANSNDANIGDNILQPGPLDGGRNPADRIGILEAFVRIDFTGPNAIDGALGWTSFRLSQARLHCYPLNPNPRAALMNMTVRKCGRTTQHTLGVVTGLGANVRVRYGTRVAFFRNQVEIRGVGGVFSRGGDSGSVVVTAGTRQPVALLFAGGGGFTFANPIQAVINGLGIQRFLS